MKRLYAALLLCFVCMAPVWAAVDLNSATEAQLQQLPGIGPTRAKAIIDDRNQHGPFESVEDLARVKGIGEKTLIELKPLVTVVPPSKVTPASPQAIPEQAQAHFPWSIVALVAAVAIVGGWFFLRRYSGGAKPASTSASDALTPSAPVARAPAAKSPGVGIGAPAEPAGNAGPPPAPAGPKPASRPEAVPNSASKSEGPPAPAGAKPKKS